MKTIEEAIKELPPGLQQEVEDLQFLIEKRGRKPRSVETGLGGRLAGSDGAIHLGDSSTQDF